MDSAWFHDEASVQISRTIIASRAEPSTPRDPNPRGSGDPSSQRQRDSGVSSGEPSLMNRFLADSRRSVATSVGSSVRLPPARHVTLGEFKNDFRGQRVAKCADKIFDIAKEFDKLRVPLPSTSRRDRDHMSSHSTKEIENRRIATTGRSSPDEVTTDIPILSSDVNNNFHGDDDEVFLPNPTNVAHQSRSKPPRTRKPSSSQPVHHDSGHSSGSSCHSGKSCKHYTIYNQYGPQPPPQPQYYQVPMPVPPPPQYYDYPPATAPLPRRKATEFVYEEPAERPRRRTSSTRHRPRQPSKTRSPTLEETRAGLRQMCKAIKVTSLISKGLTREINELDAISAGFADSMPFSKSKPIPAPLVYGSSPTIPNRVTASDVGWLVELSPRYQPLAQVIKDTLARRNVRNYVAELQNVLQRHVEVLDRQISRFQNGAALRMHHPAFNNAITERQKQRDICLEKVDELQKICFRDARSGQKLPIGRSGPQPTPDNLNYQFRLIYGCFSY
uniref:BLOC-1-related complex subunit 5 n=1 Tax=Panagrellus redivivus TaxID=6233 RepID=A0A7E4VL62_PANRE